ncbi:alpha/beta fold hydrolase [Rubripirellula sp.]|nr:alpha/beta fold hydrolase [Rubripirellula sp.]MDB4633994.1 alpha/beta fold hydrolase [Rubripirellula sp.]
MIELNIPATDGRIGWKHVSASLAKALQLDQASIAGMLPAGEIRLDSPAVSLSLLAINLAAGNRLSFAVTHSEDQCPGLLIRCDPSLLRLESQDAHASKVIVHHDEAWLESADGRPLVLCLHGLNGTHETFDGLRKNLRSCGYRTAAISYEPHRPIAMLASEVSKEVAAHLASSPQKHQLVIVGHSMGGLIAREWTNNVALENEAISGLITIGTPHQGSAWATLPPLMNLFAKGEFGVADVNDVILHAPSSPELRDIAPGSAFLDELNARDDRSDVRYTSVIGIGSPMDATTMAKIQQAFRQLESRDGFIRLIRPRIEPLLSGFDELVDGRGDGIVAAESAAMGSTSDLVRVDLSHFELVRPLNGQPESEKADHPVWQIVSDRVARCRQVPDGNTGLAGGNDSIV